MDEFLMSQKERLRSDSLGRVKRGELKVVSAAGLCGVSPRQITRAWKRFKISGDRDLLHGLRGRAKDDSACVMMVMMVMIDDATNSTDAKLFKIETAEAALEKARRWIKRHGVPRALYVDRAPAARGWCGAKGRVTVPLR